MRAERDLLLYSDKSFLALEIQFLRKLLDVKRIALLARLEFWPLQVTSGRAC